MTESLDDRLNDRWRKIKDTLAMDAMIEIRRLRKALLGGNSFKTTSELLIFLADRLVEASIDHPKQDYIEAAHDRAKMMIDALTPLPPTMDPDPVRWTDEQVIQQLESGSKLNRLRKRLSSIAARAEQKMSQPPERISSIELRRREFVEADRLLQEIE